MATYTTHYNLKKPASSDLVNIGDQNGNADIIDTELYDKVDKETGKGLSTNDFTTEEKTKLAGIESGAQVNPSAASTVPLMDGTASAGSSSDYARGDHVHPSDTTKVDKESGKGLSTNDFTDADKAKLAELSQYVGAGIIFDTASGSMASFIDGGDGLPVKSANVNVDPVQDLHGYNKPWTGGAGKNIFVLNAPAQTINGVTFTPQADGTVKVNGTATADAVWYTSNEAFTVSAGSYYLSGIPQEGTWTTFCLVYGSYSNYSAVNPVSMNLSQDTSIRGYIKVGSGYTANNLIFKPMIRKSTDSATFEPYSNICPITGHTAAVVTRTGRNILDESLFTNGKWISVYGEEQNNDQRKAVLEFLSCKPNTPYYFSCFSSSKTLLTDTFVMCVTFYDVAQNYITGYNQNVSDSVITSPSNAAYYRIAVTSSNYYANVQISSYSTRVYEPYQGQTYNVTFPTAAGTVYGGVLDVTNGVLTVNRAYTEMGSLGWYLVTVNPFCVAVIPTPTPKGFANTTKATIVCDMFETEAASASSSKTNIIGVNDVKMIMVYTNMVSSVADFKTFVANHYICYELLTPVTYTLTPQEITTLLGINHIWADTGDVSVEYAADPKLYINKVIANALNA